MQCQHLPWWKRSKRFGASKPWIAPGRSKEGNRGSNWTIFRPCPCVCTVNTLSAPGHSACQEDDRPERVEVVQPFAIVLASAASGIVAGVR